MLAFAALTFRTLSLVPEPGLQAISLSALEGTLHLPFHHHFESTDSEDVHNGNKDKDMGEHANVELSCGEQKTAVKPVVCTTSPILKWFCSVLIWISLKFQMTNKAISAICGLIKIVLRLTENPLYEAFPNSTYALFKSTSSAQIQSTKYVVCPDDACNQLYTLAEAQACKTCTSKKFGKMCCCELGYTKKMAFSKTKWIPHKLYHFVAPSVWLTHMYNNTSFCKLLQQASDKPSSANVLEGIKDGEVWKDFVMNPLHPSVPFLRGSNNIGLLLNVDWFKPFMRSEYKVSAIMMTVMNLPREVRFRKEWTMVLGVIPGPTEPKGNINTFLKPIVDDLDTSVELYANWTKWQYCKSCITRSISRSASSKKSVTVFGI